MRYDFTTRPQRSESGSSKWNSMLKINPSAFHGIVPLSVADMEFPLAPPIAQALSRFSQTSCLGYTDPTDEYYEACVLWQRRRHGWPAEKDWIATTPGVVPALFNAVRSFASEGDGVIIQPPVYRPFRDAIERGGRRVVENPLLPPDGNALGTAGRPRYRIDFEDLAIKAADPRARLLLLCSPHNPVGRVWEPAELRRLLDICVQNDVIVVSDEIHGDVTMPGHDFTSIMGVADPSDYDHIVVCTSPSKSFNIAGCQSSAIFVPDEHLRERFEEGMADAAFFQLNAFAYPATIAAYTLCDEWLEQLLGVVENNYGILRGAIEAYLPGVKVMPLEGTYLAWMDFRAWGLADAERSRILEQEAMLFLDHGPKFGAQGSGFERLNLACPSDVIEGALERLVSVAHERKLDTIGR